MEIYYNYIILCPKIHFFKKYIGGFQMRNATKTPISIQRTDKMNHMLEYLSNKWLLNPTAVMRHALAVAYEIEVKKDQCD